MSGLYLSSWGCGTAAGMAARRIVKGGGEACAKPTVVNCAGWQAVQGHTAPVPGPAQPPGAGAALLALCRWGS